MIEGVSPKKKAKESPHVQRARAKLQRRLKEIEEQITPQALQEVTKNIHKWIRRHEGERKKIEGTFKLFDGNAHPAQAESQYVREKLKEIRQEMPTGRELGNLRGRITGGEEIND